MQIKAHGRTWSQVASFCDHGRKVRPFATVVADGRKPKQGGRSKTLENGLRERCMVAWFATVQTLTTPRSPMQQGIFAPT